MIQGMTVILFEEIEQGKDEFNRPIYKENPVKVEDVLVGRPTSEELANHLNLTGKKAEYVLAIPKGDQHDWENKKVEFFGRTWRVCTIPAEGIEANIPLRWNKKVTVECYE